MKANKYSNFLTILLIIVIIAILAIVGFFVYKTIVKGNDNEKIEAFAQIDRNGEENNENGNENNTVDPEQNQNNEIIPSVDPSGNGSGSGASGGNTKKKTYYKGHVMLGYITIPTTNVKEPILDTVTPETLNTAVATLYPSNAQLNQPGNVVIVGHNYRNGQFFSNNKKLSIGDKIKIKDATGTELTYTIYKKFETSDTDTSFYNRDTKGKIEVTLSTCTDDSKARTIILARVEK